MNNTCTCIKKFVDAEDFRDHMPCPGSASEQLQISLIDQIENLQKLLNQAIEDQVETHHELRDLAKTWATDNLKSKDTERCAKMLNKILDRFYDA